MASVLSSLRVADITFIFSAYCCIARKSLHGSLKASPVLPGARRLEGELCWKCLQLAVIIIDLLVQVHCVQLRRLPHAFQVGILAGVG